MIEDDVGVCSPGRVLSKDHSGEGVPRVGHGEACSPLLDRQVMLVMEVVKRTLFQNLGLNCHQQLLVLSICMDSHIPNKTYAQKETKQTIGRQKE